MKGFKRGEKGFTLVELLIVVAILGILAAVVIPNVVGLLGRGGKQAYETDQSTVEIGADAFFSEIHTGWNDVGDNDVTIAPYDTAPASFVDDNVWGDSNAPSDPTIKPGHYFPTAIAIEQNHYLTLSGNESDIENVNNPLVVWEDGVTLATDEDIQAHAIWMGLLVQPYTPAYLQLGGYTGESSSRNLTSPGVGCARWYISVLEGETDLFLDEMPQSAMTGYQWNGDPDENSAKSGGYCWIVGTNGQVYGVYAADRDGNNEDEWYSGFSGSYP